MLFALNFLKIFRDETFCLTNIAFFIGQRKKDEEYLHICPYENRLYFSVFYIRSSFDGGKERLTFVSFFKLGVCFKLDCSST